MIRCGATALAFGLVHVASSFPVGAALLDRIDTQIEVAAVPLENLSSANQGE